MSLHKTICILFGAGLMLLGGSGTVSAEGAPGQDTSKKQLQQRIDFGNAYIMGQSIKSGAVYLMHRKQSDIDSMIKVRLNYRSEIMEDFDLENTKMVEDASKQNDERKDVKTQ